MNLSRRPQSLTILDLKTNLEVFTNTFNQAEKERQLVDGMLRYLRKFKRSQRA
jgi:hypothetical protein